jgi:hypothetical protein
MMALLALLPLVVSIAMPLVCRRWMPQSMARRYALPVALSAGFVATYGCLEPAEWLPTRHWHWMPYIALSAMIVGPISIARGVWMLERCLLTLIVAIISASVLVPTWASLEPTRKWYVCFLASYLFVLATCLPPLADRVSPKILLPLLLAIGLMLAVLILAIASVGLGLLAGIMSSALLGSGLVAYWYRDSLSLQSLVFVFSILAGGVAFVGYIDPDPPLKGLLLLPASPLALWLVEAAPRPKKSRVHAIAQMSAVVVPLLVGVVWVLLVS